MTEAQYTLFTLGLSEFLKARFPNTTFTWDEAGKTWWTDDMEIVRVYSVLFKEHDKAKIASLKYDFRQIKNHRIIIIPDFDKIGFTID